MRYYLLQEVDGSLSGVPVCFIKLVLMTNTKHPVISCYPPWRWIEITLATQACVYTRCRATQCNEVLHLQTKRRVCCHPGHRLSQLHMQRHRDLKVREMISRAAASSVVNSVSVIHILGSFTGACSLTHSLLNLWHINIPLTFSVHSYFQPHKWVWLHLQSTSAALHCRECCSKLCPIMFCYCVVITDDLDQWSSCICSTVIMSIRRDGSFLLYVHTKLSFRKPF